MTRVELRRKAPEVQAADACSVCGATQPRGPRDHLLVGTPGVPSHDGAVCESCGSVLERVVSKFGGDLSVSVQEAKQHADGSEITLPGGRDGLAGPVGSSAPRAYDPQAEAEPRT